jgi:hypothetical protein
VLKKLYDGRECVKNGDGGRDKGGGMRDESEEAFKLVS